MIHHHSLLSLFVTTIIDLITILFVEEMKAVFDRWLNIHFSVVSSIDATRLPFDVQYQPAPVLQDNV